jgi:hypothetical protein
VSTTTEPRVVDNAAEHRYELWVVDERAGVIEYGTRPGVVELIHTETDPERQLAKPLHAKVAIATAESQDLLAGRLVTATWVLSGATIALVLSTIVLVVVTLAD